jgi:hypothetical protein
MTDPTEDDELRLVLMLGLPELVAVVQDSAIEVVLGNGFKQKGREF